MDVSFGGQHSACCSGLSHGSKCSGFGESGGGWVGESRLGRACGVTLSDVGLPGPRPPHLYQSVVLPHLWSSGQLPRGPPPPRGQVWLTLGFQGPCRDGCVELAESLLTLVRAQESLDRARACEKASLSPTWGSLEWPGEPLVGGILSPKSLFQNLLCPAVASPTQQTHPLLLVFCAPSLPNPSSP